ncbi:hypothetical protein AYJ54_44395 [Bradyrhizobium centrolobii]|uniref:Uncharacterized protein n=1 Tax=Bradyrhizobium centrolobii TaxID=1505087 RepID=A0A176Z2E5_9BRAD|nr:hypothetical protein [Bradyrhizobium centrolobii]OAF13373.1 hypothetical protein AYJ54_44395 [Bradyrhizobium centrolobii]
MDQSASTEFEIDEGLSIALTDVGAWIVKADDREFRLEEINDFYRAWLLLERPFSNVKAALDQIARNANVATPFPFAKLIGSALKAQSGQWTDRAMVWVSFLAATEKASLKGLFSDVRDSKWASQKTRQLARKYMNEIERGGQGG